MSGQKGQSGGRRPGAGRKPKSALLRAVTGNPGHRGKVLVGPGMDAPLVVAPIVGVEPPEDLTSEERLFWEQLAPHATAARTLTPATAWSFRVLCRNLALEHTLALSGDKGGPNHRGILQRVDAELLRFNLSPCGKPIYDEAPVEKPVNPLEKFLTRKRG